MLLLPWCQLHLDGRLCGKAVALDTEIERRQLPGRGMPPSGVLRHTAQISEPAGIDEIAHHNRCEGKGGVAHKGSRRFPETMYMLAEWESSSFRAHKSMGRAWRAPGPLLGLRSVNRPVRGLRFPPQPRSYSLFQPEKSWTH